MEFEGYKFMRECYLRSTPPVDLDEACKDNPVDCRKHKLTTDEYQKILCEFGIVDAEGNTTDKDIRLACDMWVVNSGPKLCE